VLLDEVWTSELVSALLALKPLLVGIVALEVAVQVALYCVEARLDSW